MKVWRRTEKIHGNTLVPDHKRVTEVDEDGCYYSRYVLPDGRVYSENATTVFAMGWRSVKEFVTQKSGFKLVDETEVTK